MSTVYAESSALLRWLLGHADGGQVQATLASADGVVTSALTRLEVARALQRLLVLGQLSAADRAATWTMFLTAAKHWKVHALSDDVLDRAAVGFPVEPVRSLDALHLATAVRFSQQVGPLDMLSTDARVRDNATALGFVVVP